MTGGKRRGRPAIKSVRVEKDLRRRLESGEWGAGGLFPTEEKLTTHYSVSRMTLRQAMRPLEEEGVLIRARGSGTFVSKDFQGTVRRGHLAVILHEAQFEDEASYQDQIARGVRSAVQEENKAVTFHMMMRGELLGDLIRKNKQLASAWGGVLVPASLLDRKCLNWFSRNSIPVVSLSVPRKGMKVSSVDIDNHVAGEMAADLLLRSGCSRPLFLDNFKTSHHARARQKGFLEIVRQKKLTARMVHLPHTHSRKGQNCARRLVLPFLQKKLIDSIFVYMEQPTVGVYQALESCGITPGKEIKVIHYNDYPWLCDVLTPRPTAIRQPFDVVGREAAVMLMQRMKEPERQLEIIKVKPQLNIRESCL